MTDQEIQELFVELRRVGYDLARPPGLAIGTGFAPGALVAWLRAQPDAAGHDAIVAGMNEQIAAAAPVRAAGARDDTAEAPPPRDHPTHEQLDAAIDVLLNEWDPLGARLGVLSREDVTEHAFGLLLSPVVLPHSPSIDAERALASALGGIEEQTFGVRRGPESQRRYLARRLMRVVLDHPSPPGTVRRHATIATATNAETPPASHGVDRRRSVGATGTRRRVALGPRGDEPPALDPAATCSECGVTGTVAFVTRDIEPTLSRYCSTCWRRVRHRYWGMRLPTSAPNTPEAMIDFLDLFDELTRERPRSAGSALWEDALPTLRAAMTQPSGRDERAPAERSAHLRALAREIAARAPLMDGPMPQEIAGFVRAHADPDA